MFEMPKSESNPVLDADKRFRLLKPKSQTAKFLLAAVLSLNSGCAAFKDVFGTAFGVMTLEPSKSIKNRDIETEIEVTGGSSEVGIKMSRYYKEAPGDRRWWDKGDGVYASEDQKTAWDQNVLLANQIRHELEERVEDLSLQVQTAKTKKEKQKLRQEIKWTKSELLTFIGLSPDKIPEKSLLEFKGEHGPTEPVAYHHYQPGEMLSQSMHLSLEPYQDFIPVDAGVKMIVRDVTTEVEEPEPSVPDTTAEESLKNLANLGRSGLEQAALQDAEKADVLGAIRSDLILRGWSFSPPLAEGQYPYPVRGARGRPAAVPDLALYSSPPEKDARTMLDEIRLHRSLISIPTEREISFRLSQQDEVPTDFEEQVLSSAFALPDTPIGARDGHIGVLIHRDIASIPNPDDLDPRIWDYIQDQERIYLEKVKGKDMTEARAETDFSGFAEWMLSNLSRTRPDKAVEKLEKEISLKQAGLPKAADLEAAKNELLDCQERLKVYKMLQELEKEIGLKQLNLQKSSDIEIAKNKLVDYLERLMIYKMLQESVIKEARQSALEEAAAALEPFILTAQSGGTQEIRFHVVVKDDKLAVLAVPDREAEFKVVKTDDGKTKEIPVRLTK